MANVANNAIGYVIDGPLTEKEALEWRWTQEKLRSALKMLSKQRVYIMTKEHTHSTQEKLDTVEARLQALCVFAGMPDAETMEDPIFRQLLMPLDLPIAEQEEFRAYWKEEKDKQEATTGDETDLPASQNNTSPKLSRKSRPVDSSTTWVSDYGKVQYLSMSPTIVKLQDGSFIELRCDICGGNSSHVHNALNKGLRGFCGHFRQVHNDNAKPDAVLQRCKYRDVPAGEVGKIISGQSQIEALASASSTRLDSNKVYFGKPTENTESKRKRAGNTVEGLAAAADAKEAAKASDTTSDAANPSSSSMPPPATPKKRKLTSSFTAINASASVPTTPAAPPTTTSRPRKRDRSVPYLANCSIIVQNTLKDGGDNKFYELRCDICQGNGSFGSGKLLEGVKGFKAHLRQIHHEENPLTADILRRCSHREVPLQEVQEIQKGVVNVGFRVCEHSPHVRPKKSYKDFNSAERT